MIKMVKCPACNGRGMIGYSTKTDDGVAFYDFECDFCKGRCWVSKRRAEKYERDTQKERKRVKKGVGKTLKGTGEKKC